MLGTWHCRANSETRPNCIPIRTLEEVWRGYVQMPTLEYMHQYFRASDHHSPAEWSSYIELMDFPQCSSLLPILRYFTHIVWPVHPAGMNLFPFLVGE